MQNFSLSLISVALLGASQMGFANTTADSINLSTMFGIERYVYF